MDIKEILKQVFPFLLPTITVLLFVILLLLLNDREYIQYQQKKNAFCGVNQVMELENTLTDTSNSKVTYILLIITTVLALTTAIIAFILEKDTTTIAVPSIILVVTLISAIVIPTTQFSKPDYSIIIKRIADMLRNSDFINLSPNAANTNKSYFDSPNNALIDLKNSILDKYTSYKEEQNKNNYYVRSDVEEELKSIFVNKTTPEAFATELVKYMNFPHDAKLLNSSYEKWYKSNAACGTAINTINSNTTSGLEKNNARATYEQCMLRVPTTVPYKKDTQRDAPMYLTWLLLIILFYYFMHPFYETHRFYLILTIVVIVFVFMLYYIMGVRNNL